MSNSSYNQATIIGNLGSDPEPRRTATGTSVVDLRVATETAWTDGDGSEKKRTDWHKVTVWGRSADNVAKYLKKGARVHVVGPLQVENFEDRDGNKRTSVKIKADSILFL